MKEVFVDEVDCKRILREVTLMRKLDHPGVVNLIEIIKPADPANFDTIYLVMGLEKSDLKKILKSNNNFNLDQIKSIVYSLLKAINYLHESQVIHRDLKPANVLLKSDCTIKLCDYGLARSLTKEQSAPVYQRKNSGTTSEESDVNPEETNKEEAKTNGKPKMVKSKGMKRGMSREMTKHV